ncbi:MAG: diguanylate cyclase [Ketobacter sp.]|nr:MAG: diguanylate cyclase [Ketobacter sp.]
MAEFLPNKIRVRCRLLYVEDDPVQALLIKPLLEDESFAVVHVANGYEALDSLRRNQFDIVLTDYRMPNMDGITLIKEINSAQINLPIVILTAANDVSLAFAALDAGAADFITKDAESNYLDIIAPILMRALGKFELQRRADLLAEKLEEEKNLSHLTLDTLIQGVVVVDTEYQLQYCNQHFKDTFSVPADIAELQTDIESLGPLLQDNGVLSGASDAKAIADLLVRLLKGEQKRAEFELNNGRLYDIRSTRLDHTGFVLTFTDVTHQKQQMLALSRTIEWAPVAMIAVNSEGQIVLANNKACALCGYEKPELLNARLDKLLTEDARAGYPALMQSYFNAVSPQSVHNHFEMKLKGSGGKLIPVEISLSGIETFNEPRVLATIVDISHRKEAEAALRRAHELTQSIVDNSPFSIIATDVEGYILAASPALEALLLYNKDELVGQGNALQFHLKDELETRAAELSSELSENIMPCFSVLVEKANRGVVESQKWSYVRKDGSVVPVSLTVTLLRTEDDVVTGYLLVAYDITEQLRANERIQHIAHHDQLTGLPNRMLLQDRLSTSLKRIKRFGKQVGIMLLDLDRFKQINDSLGHAVGDELLIAMAQRMSSVVRESDTVSRLGGDEFVIILPDLSSVDDAVMICNKVVEAIRLPLTIGEHLLNVTTSVGLSVAPDHGMDMDALIKNADIAMYNAKQEGRDGFKLYSKSLTILKASGAEKD